MNTRTLYLNLVAAALLVGAGSAQAGTLSEAIRVQADSASMAIRAEARAGLHAMPLIVDVPGVEVGKIELVESTEATDTDAAPQALLETTAANLSDALRRELVAKALAAPGMFGVYRYMTESALKVAIIVAE